jgi:hypothetical protein
MTIFGPKREEEAGRWGRLNNEELHNLHFSPNVIRVITSIRMRRVGHIARMGELNITHKILVEKYGGKKPRGRYRRRWKDNVTMDIREIEREGVGWIHQGQV